MVFEEKRAIEQFHQNLARGGLSELMGLRRGKGEINGKKKKGWEGGGKRGTFRYEKDSI